jgi:hypothetical protein
MTYTRRSNGNNATREISHGVPLAWVKPLVHAASATLGAPQGPGCGLVTPCKFVWTREHDEQRHGGPADIHCPRRYEIRLRLPAGRLHTTAVRASAAAADIGALYWSVEIHSAADKPICGKGLIAPPEPHGPHAGAAYGALRAAEGGSQPPCCSTVHQQQRTSPHA